MKIWCDKSLLFFSIEKDCISKIYIYVCGKKKEEFIQFLQLVALFHFQRHLLFK